MNTRLWLQPWSDPCLKSTEQQSQQVMGAMIASYGESQQAARLRIKALFVWWAWSPLYSSGRGLSSTPFWTLAWTRQITSDLKYFRSTSSRRWSIKPTFSSLHSTLITFALGPSHSATLPRSAIFILYLTLNLLINTFDANACCSNKQSGECLRCN